nr:hypothetical protein Q903MT_gene3326 [Picea sitchensis]
MDSTVSPTRVARLLSLVPFATTSASFSKNARSSKITMSKACPFGAHCLFTRTEALLFLFTPLKRVECQAFSEAVLRSMPMHW